METNEIVLDAEIEKVLPEDAVSFIKTEAFQLSREIVSLKVGNREQYEKACELGIANANILKRLEDLKKAMLSPLDIEVKRLKKAFDKAEAIFSGNDEKIRKALEAYQVKVDVDNIKTIRTEVGSATVQERKDWEIENESLIPKEYFKLDEAKIGKVIRAGGAVPGIKTKTVYSTAFKAA